MTMDPHWQKAKQLTEEIPGWLSDIENRFLFESARRAPRGTMIVEIGSYKGRSTIYLALGSKAGKGNPVFAIDPHTGSPDLLRPGERIWTYDEFTANVARSGVSDIVRPVVATGEDTVRNWNEPVCLLFIDANYHSYELTKNLLRLWIPHLMEGGMLLLNNVAPSFYGILRNKPLTGLPGPRRAAREELFLSPRFRRAGTRGCIGYAKKSAVPSISDGVRGFLTLRKVAILYGLLWLYREAGKLPQPVKNVCKMLYIRMSRAVRF